ncbi:reverse transcriptase domain-containing protein [Tanacetum coccineum]
MKLNPKQCAIGIEEGMFLGYKVNTKGIKLCSDKVDVVLALPSPKCLKDIQKLNGKLASLNRFLAKSAEKSLPTAHIIVPMEKEELIVYFAAAKEAVSAVLMIERETKQMPIYFVSRVLQGPEINYTPMEKLVLALVHESKQLKKYFQAFTISRDCRNRVLRWDNPMDMPMETEEDLLDLWTLFTNGSSCIDAFGAGLILTNSEGAEFTYTLRFRANGYKNLQANVDSRLVASQVNRSYVAKEPGMIQYLEKVKTLASNFRKFSIKQVPRSENKKSDALSKLASTSFAHLTKQVLVEELKEKSINEAQVLAFIEEEGDT